MKIKIISSFLIMVPIVIWADVGDRLNIVLWRMDGVPCESLFVGQGIRQVGANSILAGRRVELLVAATHADYTLPVGTPRLVRIGVLDVATLPFLSEGPDDNISWDTVRLETNNPNFPGWSVAIDTVTTWRATTHQRGASPKDILEYVFIVEDASNIPPLFLPDTSNPLDSVIPGQYVNLLLRLPGEEHYPGDKSLIGKRGMPKDWDAVRLYDCWVYATDGYYNAVPYNPAAVENVHLEPCFSAIEPDSVIPVTDTLFTEVPHDGVIDSVAKKLFEVEYADTGWAGLKAIGSLMSRCEHFAVTGRPPTPDDPIVVVPNPCGTPGEDVDIIIRRVKCNDVKGKIYDSFGYVVRDFTQELMDQLSVNPAASLWFLKWDVKNDKGHRVANGCYQLCVETIAVEKSGVFKKKIGVVW
ncbi:MAG: hypothetical protein HY769_03225 [Candidatus Stahlbacteria bacterium]|nr:hypothetical protein [Candidatus Stahlbacteria bacterium]